MRAVHKKASERTLQRSRQAIHILKYSRHYQEHNRCLAQNSPEYVEQDRAVRQQQRHAPLCFTTESPSVTVLKNKNIFEELNAAGVPYVPTANLNQVLLEVINATRYRYFIYTWKVGTLNNSNRIRSFVTELSSFHNFPVAAVLCMLLERVGISIPSITQFSQIHRLLSVYMPLKAAIKEKLL